MNSETGGFNPLVLLRRRKYYAEVLIVATKSFLKNINIKTAKQAHNLIDALEKAERHCGDEVVMSRVVNEVPRDQMKKFVKNIRGLG